jgi:hypothetical protein
MIPENAGSFSIDHTQDDRFFPPMAAGIVKREIAKTNPLLGFNRHGVGKGHRLTLLAAFHPQRLLLATLVCEGIG